MRKVPIKKTKPVGRQEGLEDRIKKYEEFTGAKHLAFEPEKNVNTFVEQKVFEHLKAIKQSFTFGLGKPVVIAETEEILRKLKSKLTKTEIDNVVFLLAGNK